MTEGPEATYIARYVSKYFKGKRLKSITIKAGRYKRHGPPKRMNDFEKDLPMKLIDVYKKGKVIFLSFENNWCIIAKMGMTGWLSKPEEKVLFEDKPNVVFHFDNDDLYFYDFRNFGTLTFTQDPMEIMKELNNIAPDVLDKETAAESIYEQVNEINIVKKKPNMLVEELLMDQSLVMSGIGNIIKSELLYDAKISPKRTLKSLDKNDWEQLFLSARKISSNVLKNLESRKSTTDDYFALHKVYQKEKDPQGNEVKKHKAKDGRSTFWVPEIQN